MPVEPGKVRDIRGVEIDPGDRVVVTTVGRRRLMVGTVRLVGTIRAGVKRVLLNHHDGEWEPDQVAVLQKATSPERGSATSPIREYDRNSASNQLLAEVARESPEHMLTIGVVSGGWRADCSCGKDFPWHQVGRDPRKDKDKAQQDAVAHLREVRGGRSGRTRARRDLQPGDRDNGTFNPEPRRLDGEEYTKASGAAVCMRCSRMYSLHPAEVGSTGDLADNPLVLYRLCDGRLVKL